MKSSSILVVLLGSTPLVGCGDPDPPTATHPGPAPARAPSFEVDVAPALDRYCLGCHDSETGRGGVVLDDLDGEGPDVATWARVADALRSGSMPPTGRPRPSAAERSAIDAWVDSEVFRCSAGPGPNPGRVTMRRLNRAQYDNTIRDLLGLDLHLADAFPADDVGDGFDDIGDVLSTPPILVERQLEAADRAIEAASASPEAWSRIMDPAPDEIPPHLRKPARPVRSEPVKRIGRPEPVAPVTDPKVLALRRAFDVLRGFADRAYRRPAAEEELNRLVELVDSALGDGDTFDEAIRYALKAVLISPSFLFLVEEDSPDGTLGDFELASRLSYFLWSGPPDAELRRLAAHGELRQPGRLAEQARRMLRDPKAGALVVGFVDQWLQVRALGDAAPDPALFPDFDEPLRRSMLGETERFAGAIAFEDRSVLEFLKADFTFVDGRLARHYGIPGVSGDEFRRVSLAGTARGGILTHASVLTVTSNPTRTSPVRRGRWVLDVLLGMPPAPPPSGVEGLVEENAQDPPKTLRRRMERHRADPNCSTCHSRMDPIGFALEEFDAIGARRDSEGGKPVDASGSLPGFGDFRGAEGLRDALASRPDAFARCLAEKLLTYAIGRGVVPADRCAVAAIARDLARDDYRFSSLVGAVVESPPFRRRSPARKDP